MSARRSQTRNGGTMPAACFDVRPSPSPAVPCRDHSNTRTPSKAPYSSLSPRKVSEAYSPTQNACFDVPNIPGSGAAPRVLPFSPVACDTTRSCSFQQAGVFQQVGDVAFLVVADISRARAKKRAGQ